MGVSTLQVRTRQQHSTTRCSQDCHTAQRDKRTTTATSTTSSRKHHNICTDQTNGDRVLQSNSIIHQATSNHNRQRQPRTGTDGHRSNVVQQGKRKEGQAQGQRKVQQRQRLQELREQLQRQQLQRRKRQIQSTTGWTRKSIQRTTWIWQRKRIQQQRKRQRVLRQPSRRKRSKRKTRQQMFATDVDNQDTWRRVAIYNQDQSQMHQLALPQPPQVADASVVPISGLHEVTIAMIGTTQQPQEDNKWVNLMIDSGAATHVCPLWFAPQFPLHQQAHGTGSQLRTVTNQHFKLHGYRWVCVTNHSGQQIVIPFYVCDVKQPILSVTRLVEQGFQLTLDDNPR